MTILRHFSGGLIFAAILILAGLFIPGLSTSSWADDENSGPQDGHWFVSGLAAWEEAPGELDLTSGDAGIGAGLGYMFTERWGAELLYFKFKPDYEVAGIKGSDDSYNRWLNLLYLPEVNSSWQPYLTAGLGRAEFNYEAARGERKTDEFNGGVGVFRSLSERVMFRADARLVHTRSVNDNRPFVSVGLTAMLGALAPKVVPDADADGVPDVDDQCPNTPPGRAVDVRGCELDGDEDGVVDGDDACPNTPEGAAVDARGCALDSDRDGVPDYLDQCPDSEAGAKVDEKGCYIELEETVTIDLNLEFDTNSADIRPRHIPEIQRVVDFLRQYPTAHAVIEGHTDSSGSAAYNQKLSERRAEAVRAYLVKSSGIAAERLTSVGYGEERPIASNDSAEGMQKNRRVSAVISGTHTVRQ